ncbi:sensor histidine kinase [Mobilicoccus caccae]|uniref:sensor histidine kinase n=1 Tax=Mobilicoccus caccae TaxID=1859295 RepID=UPI0024E05AA7|nr:ATP-binding protein [Mobilicoccus caccae]
MIRVVQEALTNVRKHSGARSARVRIESEPGSVLFVVEDDGRGFDAADLTEERYGLATMTERTQLLDGWLTIDSSPGHGTRIVLGVPAGRGVHAVSTPVQA